MCRAYFRLVAGKGSWDNAPAHRRKMACVSLAALMRECIINQESILVAVPLWRKERAPFPAPNTRRQRQIRRGQVGIHPIMTGRILYHGLLLKPHQLRECVTATAANIAAARIQAGRRSPAPIRNSIGSPLEHSRTELPTRWLGSRGDAHGDPLRCTFKNHASSRLPPLGWWRARSPSRRPITGRRRRTG
jgi:hypothetical protein